MANSPFFDAKAILYKVHNYDGTTWELELLEDAGHLMKGHVIRFYNDNPGVYGVPEPSLDFGGWTFSVEDLVDALDSDRVVVLLHCGEVTRIDK